MLLKNSIKDGVQKMEITSKTKPDKILQYFRECNETSKVNLKTSFGFVYLVGGILNKLENHDHYMAINNFWVKV